jgi:hypothetical protein
MTRTMTCAAFPLLLFLSVTLALIRTQPYDDREWRDLLLPPDCPAPCFLGIRPGGTSVEEALRLLEHDQRVEQVTRRYDAYLYRPIVNWSWRNNIQHNAEADSNGFIYLLQDRKPVVQALRANPGIAMGYLNLILGKPTCLITVVDPFAHNQSYYVLVYRERLLVVSAAFDSRYHFDYGTPGHLEYISQATFNRIGYPNSLCERQTGG